MPRKPTQPFGHLSFSNAGKVTKVTRQLSSDKQVQESQVVEDFIGAFNQLNGGSAITGATMLSERDQDAAAVYAGVGSPGTELEFAL